MHNDSSQNQFEYNVQCPSLFTKSALLLKSQLNDSNKLHFSISAYLNVATALPAAILNLSLIITFFKMRLLDTLSNIPLIFLAICDLLTTVISQPLFAVYLIQLRERDLLCNIFTAIVYIGPTTVMTSSLLVLVITTERYLALFHAFFWKRHVTRRMLVIPLAMAWAPSLLFCVFMFDTKNNTAGAAIFAFCSVLALIWITFCYLKMFRRIRQMLVFPMNTAETPGYENEANRRKQARLSKYSIVIIAVYLVFTIPYSLISMLIHSGVLGKGGFIQALEWYIITFVMMNSFANPIVNAWQIPQLGRGMLHLWHIRKPQEWNTTQANSGDQVKGNQRTRGKEQTIKVIDIKDGFT